ncbi:MAG: metal-dependent hydrolase [Methanobrevibacter sp.]|jgi:inner membrane protein|nr:metal-dependent hydrolase [Candidatus Methanovirga basalitermitum]
MSSYKVHSLFALILSLFYFLNPIYCLLTILGANISDFDHDVKKTELYKMTIIGLTIFITLYVLKSSYFIGVLILLMVIIFYFSKHRGFTHSLVGGLVLTSLIFAMIFFSMEISYQIPSNLNIDSSAILELISVLLCILFVNKKISYIIIGFFVLWILMFPVTMINLKFVAFSIFLGFLSHLILDSFSPTGVELLNPFSSKKFGRKFSIFMTFLLIIIVIIYKTPII